MGVCLGLAQGGHLEVEMGMNMGMDRGRARPPVWGVRVRAGPPVRGRKESVRDLVSIHVAERFSYFRIGCKVRVRIDEIDRIYEK